MPRPAEKRRPAVKTFKIRDLMIALRPGIGTPQRPKPFDCCLPSCVDVSDDCGADSIQPFDTGGCDLSCEDSCDDGSVETCDCSFDTCGCTETCIGCSNLCSFACTNACTGGCTLTCGCTLLCTHACTR